MVRHPPDIARTMSKASHTPLPIKNRQLRFRVHEIGVPLDSSSSPEVWVSSTADGNLF